MQMGDNNDIPDWIPCPSCGCEAYWDGAVYFCDQCGWSGDVEDIEELKHLASIGSSTEVLVDNIKR